MRNELRDIVKHTGGALGFIEIVKVIGSDTATEIESLASDKSVIIKGHLIDPLADLKGVFGLTNLGLLKQLVEFPNYKTDGATVSVKYRDRGGENIAEEIIFKDEAGSKDHYRLMAKEVIPEQPKFLGASWNVEIAPTKSMIKEFAQRAGMYSSQETHFQINTVDGDLVIFFGDPEAASHKGTMVFEKGVLGTLRAPLAFPISQTLQILRLSDGADCTMSITDKGALQIAIESGLAVYNYILPSKKNQ
jgi:hypothetical protein